jgi:hypothetical protein
MKFYWDNDHEFVIDKVRNQSIISGLDISSRDTEAELDGTGPVIRPVILGFGRPFLVLPNLAVLT